MASFALTGWDWSLDYCESWSCRHSYDECWTPSCGMVNYATNRDFFQFYFRDYITDYDLDWGFVRGIYKNLKKSRRRRILAFRRQIKEMKLQQKRLRALERKQRKLMWKKIRKSFNLMRKHRLDYFKNFHGYTHCDSFFNCFESSYYLETSDGGSSSEASSDGDGSTSGSMEEGSGDLSGEAEGDDEDEDESGQEADDGDMGGEDEDFEETDEDDESAQSEESGNSGNASDMTDSFEAMEQVIRKRGNVIEMIRKNSQKHVGTLSLYLNSYHDDDARNILLYGDMGYCDSGCRLAYGNLYTVWNSVLYRLRKYYYRKIKVINGCRRRRRLLRRAFKYYCRSYPVVIRNGLTGYYDYLINWNGCGDINW